MLKLNLGCGWRDFGQDWIHIDGGDYPHLHSKDISNLPFQDNSVDLIYASHVLEYFDRQEAEDLLKRWYNKLKPGGIVRLAVPDFTQIVRLYLDAGYSLSKFLGPLYGKMPMGQEMIYHRTAYDFQELENLLEICGFKEVCKYEWQQTEHASFDDHSQAYLPHMDKENGVLISLNVQAIKK